MLPLPKTDMTLLFLTDNSPADPDTIKTAIEKGLSLTKQSGQEVFIFTSDQQFYKVTILFHNPTYIKCVVPILGVMLAGNGLKEVLTGAFVGVDKIHSGKKYPQNF